MRLVVAADAVAPIVDRHSTQAARPANIIRRIGKPSLHVSASIADRELDGKGVSCVCPAHLTEWSNRADPLGRLGREAGRLGGEVVLFAKVGGAGRGSAELDDRSLGVAGLLEEVGAHGMEAVVVAEPFAETVEHGKAGAWSVGHRGGDRPVERHHRFPVIRSSRP